MIQPNKNQLEIIKRIELQILDAIKEICESEGIQYFILYGTLIGAVRHEGFIPWDDDIDIGMKRKDYERFLQVAPSRLPADYMIVSYLTSDGYGESLAKVMARGTKMEEVFTSQSRAEKGVFVDVFPLDSAPREKRKQIVHQFKNYVYRKLILLNRDYYFGKTGLKGVAYSCLKFISKRFDCKKIIKLHRDNAMRYVNEHTGLLVNLCSPYGYIKELQAEKLFDKCVQVRFESNFYSAPESYDKILKHIYGDYMTLPPEEERINRHVLYALDLGKYEVQ